MTELGLVKITFDWQLSKCQFRLLRVLAKERASRKSKIA